MIIDNPSNNSKLFNISVYFSTYQKAGTKLEIKDSKNETIISHTSAKVFSHASIGSEKFQLGETYTVYLDDEKYKDFTINNIVTMVRNSNSNTNMLPQRR